MARSRTDESTEKPTFSVIYPLGGGGKTLPGYEDQTIDKTIAQHVEAVGGTMVTQGKPTVLLAVNTPHLLQALVKLAHENVHSSDR